MTVIFTLKLYISLASCGSQTLDTMGALKVLNYLGFIGTREFIS